MNRTKLTPFVRKKVLELIELGIPEGRAAHAVGITPQTFINWKHRGENPTPNNGDDIFLNLLNSIEESKARFIEKNVRRIDKTADKNSEDAKWLLERRDPGEFGKRDVLEVGPSKVLIALQEQARLSTTPLIAPKGNTDIDTE